VRIVVDDADAVYPVVIDPLLAETSDAQLEEDLAVAGFGVSVAGAGDVNGDGYGDVIVGAWRFDSGETDEGAAFVYLGSPTGIAATHVAMIQADVANAYLGISVAGAGNVDGDEYADVIVGARGYSNGEIGEGAVFVFEGSGSSTGIIASGNPSNANAAIESNFAAGNFGAKVASAGDVNNDGFDDVITMSPWYGIGDDFNEGAAFLFLGSDDGISSGDLSVAATVLETDQLGASVASVAGAGDVNNDGCDDVMMGAIHYDATFSNEGAVFVFHGNSGTGIADGNPSTANAVLTSGQADSAFGAALAAGDMDGDGYSDVIVGAETYDLTETNEGAVFVFRGSYEGVDSTADATFQSNQANSKFGSSVAAGEFAGDGADDLLIGARDYDNGQTNEGAAFLFLGSNSSSLSGGSPSTAAAQLEVNQAGANFGTSVASGDVNGDFTDDAIVGAHFYDDGENNEGAAFVYEGPQTYTVNWLLPAAGDDPIARSVPELSTSATVDMSTPYDDSVAHNVEDEYDLVPSWSANPRIIGDERYFWGTTSVVRQKGSSAALTVTFADPVPANRVVLMLGDLAGTTYGQLALSDGTAGFTDFTDFVPSSDPRPPSNYAPANGRIETTNPSNLDPPPNNSTIYLIGNSTDTVKAVEIQINDMDDPPDDPANDWTNIMVGVRTPIED
jgi:hypothetical protein